MAQRWNPPPTWPAPPPGWRPPPGWTPHPSWGPPPPGWSLWVEEGSWVSRNRAAAVVLGLVAVAALGVVGTATYRLTRPPETVALGTPVEDGDLEFTVTSVDCGQTEVSSGYSTSRADGEYCVVQVTVRNTGSSTATVSGFQQKLLSGSGEQYDAETFVAAVALDGDLAFESINPGNSKSGPLLFDVPAGADIAQVELHGDYTGDGVRVTVP